MLGVYFRNWKYLFQNSLVIRFSNYTHCERKDSLVLGKRTRHVFKEQITGSEQVIVRFWLGMDSMLWLMARLLFLLIDWLIFAGVGETGNQRRTDGVLPGLHDGRHESFEVSLASSFMACSEKNSFLIKRLKGAGWGLWESLEEEV